MLERPSQKMFSKSLDLQREHSTHQWVGLGDSHPGDDSASPDPREGGPQGPTLTCPPSSNGPTWENHAREQNQVGMITVGPLEVNT